MGSICSSSKNDVIIEEAFKRRNIIRKCNKCNEDMKQHEYIMHYGFCKWCRAFPQD